MTGKQRLSLFPSVLLILLVLLQPIRIPTARGAELLEQKHASAGVECVGCHQRVPPSGSAPQEVCIGCHGDLHKVAERTRNRPHNPHDSHQDDLSCDACHHLHKPSVDFCAQCHTFGFKVP